MSEALLIQARRGDSTAFEQLVRPYRRELHVHCYRILGSVQDAEDVVQETLLAAWRGLDRFEERSSLRAWLYRIATNRCLNALRADKRRPDARPREETKLPARPTPTRIGESLWLQPFPDTLLEGLPDTAPGPETRIETREAISLAFVAALQHLTPRQRATLVLRDVLGMPAATVADILECSPQAVASALKRARTTLRTSLHTTEHAVPPLPDSPQERRVVAGFVKAFESGHIDDIVALLTEDVLITMPPLPFEYQGRLAATEFLATVCHQSGREHRLIPTRANMQPAFGYYVRDARTAIARTHGLLVLTIAGDRICGITRFLDSSTLPYHGLPRTLQD